METMSILIKQNVSIYDMNLKDGEKLVRLARQVLENYFKNQEAKKLQSNFRVLRNAHISDIEKWDISGFKKKLGVFVSLHTYPEHNLRGCIGFPIAHMPLWQSVKEAAKSAAFEDPRFLPLSKEELKEIIIEI
jgi:hypothetical protein